MDEVLARAGSNIPVVDLAAALEPTALQAWLDLQFWPQAERAAELVAAGNRFSEQTQEGIVDDATAGKATDFLRQLKAAIKQTDDQRAKIKAPVLVAQRAIDGASKGITDKLGAIANLAEGRVTNYLRKKEAAARAAAAEEARRREEEAARLTAAAEATMETPAVEEAVAAMEAADQAAVRAAAPAADLSRTRTELGGVASLRANWTFEVTDKMAFLRAALAGEISLDYVQPNEDMLKYVAKAQKDKAAVPGVRFFNDAKATIR